MSRKQIVIMGDSYSTFKGFIPKGYACYYPHDNDNDVTSVCKTWWYMLKEETGAEIALNNSWSGSTVCFTGYGGDCSKTSSFIHRLEKLTEKGFFKENEPHRFYVFGGTNDSWTGNNAGEVIYSDWSREDLFLILPGYSYFISKLLDVIKKEKIHIIVNSGLRPEVQNGIIEIAEHYKITYTLLKDIEKVEGHPTFRGMTQIKEQILKTEKSE